MNMKKVEIYSTPTCHFCHMAKEFFAANNVPFTDYNVASDKTRQSEMIEKSGQMGVPVIIINDQDLIVGFDQRKVSELLGIAA
ncbi:NrdH-redoxin [Candidatus Parcubacteria bacterium]|nr:NrdH-redoxin [Candidatus Parcubacteria bacterium]